MAAATLVPAVIVWLLVGAANPPHRGLPDIATGLMQFGLAAFVAAASFAVSMIATTRHP